MQEFVNILYNQIGHKIWVVPSFKLTVTCFWDTPLIVLINSDDLILLQVLLLDDILISRNTWLFISVEIIPSFCTLVEEKDITSSI